MRILERNKQTLWYANPISIEQARDENGLLTGEKVIKYGIPVKCRMSMAISSGANNLGSQGMAELEPYGITTGYTHRAVTEDMNCQMGEESIIWYKKLPYDENSVTWEMLESSNWEDLEDTIWDTLQNGELTPHNFKVVRKAVSLNHLIYYLKEVDVK